MSTSVCFLVDGFNLYHAIRETRGKTGADCRWLDIRSLCESRLYLIDPTARIAQIHYFSALAHHLEKSRPGTVVRHTRYLDAINSSAIVEAAATDDVGDEESPLPRRHGSPRRGCRPAARCAGHPW
jgi:hypothetical protein